jgi:hypothetical protein
MTGALNQAATVLMSYAASPIRTIPIPLFGEPSESLARRK